VPVNQKGSNFLRVPLCPLRLKDFHQRPSARISGEIAFAVGFAFAKY
jgi:hypothetical protein